VEEVTPMKHPISLSTARLFRSQAEPPSSDFLKGFLGLEPDDLVLKKFGSVIMYEHTNERIEIHGWDIKHESYYATKDDTEWQEF
jgi:hypothetical protein